MEKGWGRIFYCTIFRCVNCLHLKQTKLKMKNCCFIILLIAFCNQSFAQDSKVKIHRISLSDITIQRGVCGGGSPYFSFDDFHLLNPNSILLSNNYDGFNNSQSTYHANNFATLSTGIHFSKKEKTSYRNNPVIRLGVSYYNYSTIYDWLSTETHFVYANLTSTHSNLVVYVDSVYRKNLNMRYDFNQVHFAGSVIFRTSYQKRFSFYSGVGFTAGTSLNTTSEISYNEGGYDEIQFPQESGYFSQTSYPWRHYIDIGESFKNKNSFTYGTYIPLGVDFKLGKKNKILKLLHLTFEMKGELSELKIPELKTYLVKTLGGSFGLKFGS